MIHHRFGLRSQSNLIGVHPALIDVTMRALQLSTVDFAVTEGLRGMERQKKLVKQNKSKTLASRHLTGHAVDVAAMPDGKLSWAWDYYEQIAIAFKKASEELKIPIEWGGDWATFKDGPHFQLPYAAYPKPMDATTGVQA